MTDSSSAEKILGKNENNIIEISSLNEFPNDLANFVLESHKDCKLLKVHVIFTFKKVLGSDE